VRNDGVLPRPETCGLESQMPGFGRTRCSIDARQDPRPGSSTDFPRHRAAQVARFHCLAAREDAMLRTCELPDPALGTFCGHWRSPVGSWNSTESDTGAVRCSMSRRAVQRRGEEPLAATCRIERPAPAGAERGAHREPWRDPTEPRRGDAERGRIESRGERIAVVGLPPSESLCRIARRAGTSV
jgi:hypothetical protein